MVSTIEIGDPITIEVQPYSEKVVIGNNFPNPFNIQTFIPITIPEDHTEVHLSIVNSAGRSEEHTSELQSRGHLVCRLLLEKKKNQPSSLTSPLRTMRQTTS